MYSRNPTSNSDENLEIVSQKTKIENIFKSFSVLSSRAKATFTTFCIIQSLKDINYDKLV